MHAHQQRLQSGRQGKRGTRSGASSTPNLPTLSLDDERVCALCSKGVKNMHAWFSSIERPCTSAMSSESSTSSQITPFSSDSETTLRPMPYILNHVETAMVFTLNQLSRFCRHAQSRYAVFVTPSLGTSNSSTLSSLPLRFAPPFRTCTCKWSWHPYKVSRGVAACPRQTPTRQKIKATRIGVGGGWETHGTVSSEKGWAALSRWRRVQQAQRREKEKPPSRCAASQRCGAGEARQDPALAPSLMGGVG